MRFKVICKHVGESLSNAWEEDYNRAEIANAEQAIAWAQDTIAGFNASLRPGELARVVVGVRMGAGKAELPHKWRKSNLVMVMGERGGPSFDTYKCERCEATGKRYGLGDNITLDKKFKGQEFCREES